MDRRAFIEASAVLTAAAVIPGMSFAAEAVTALPKPKTSGGKPLLDAIRERRTQREFDPAPLPAQVLSDLLWAAFGINRPDSGRRSAPSAWNRQVIDVYAALPDGMYAYQFQGHALKKIVDKDIRALCGKQDFVATAPLNLVYVADLTRSKAETLEVKLFTAAADAGHISENVYLFSSSEGLATVFRLNIDKEALAKAMGLGPDLAVIASQSVGYPKK